MVRTGFTTSSHGFAFPNWFPPGTPVIELPTPFGRIPIGDAHGGVCGGMVHAALDFYLLGESRPDAVTPRLIAFLGRRLLESWDLPFGVLKYYDWQRRPRLTRLTAETEWPKIRALLDTGRPAPLGLVKVHSFDPRKLAKNHQALAHGYDLDDGRVTLHVYDPNYPGDDSTTLTLRLDDPDGDWPVEHSREGPTVRGLFVTGYSRPATLPRFD